MPDDFSQTLAKAIDEKSNYITATVLPDIVSNYRGLHEYVNSLLSMLAKKALIKEDPYRLDKKITHIIVPDSEPFAEQERSKVIGIRLSDYERMLDYLCNYFRFSIQNLSLENIKKLVALNGTFIWNSLTPNNPKPNTQGLGRIVMPIFQGSDIITKTMLSDIISGTTKLTATINNLLKEVTALQKEAYKQMVRNSVFTNPSFTVSEPVRDSASLIPNIKKIFISAVGKQPFYTELICEAIEEEYGTDKAYKRSKVLESLSTVAQKKKKKVVKVDTKEMLLGSVRVLASVSPQLSAIANKITENKILMDSEHNSLFDKFKAALRKAFNLAPKPVVFSITLTDSSTQSQHTEQLNYDTFIGEILRRVRLYAMCASPDMSGYQKLAADTEGSIYDFITRQLAECQKLMVRLEALDAYFKKEADPKNKGKIRGLKIELTAVKNSLIKANQYRAEYSAYVEEQQQMQALGITDDDL